MLIRMYNNLGRSFGLVNCCWSSPAQSFLVPSPARLLTIFYFLTTRSRATVVVEELNKQTGLFWLHYSGFQRLGVYRHTDSEVISLASFLFFQNKESRLKIKAGL
jgi:hypothetical protein